MSEQIVASRIAEAETLRGQGRSDESLAILVELSGDHPDDAVVALECAWAHDRLGLEEAAVPHYQRAIRLGMNDERLRGASLGLGSTLRALGRYEESLETLGQALTTFPDDNSIRVFHAMALYNNGLAKDACEQLLKLLIDTTGDERIRGYGSALETYAEDLDATW